MKNVWSIFLSFKGKFKKKLQRKRLISVVALKLLKTECPLKYTTLAPFDRLAKRPHRLLGVDAHDSPAPYTYTHGPTTSVYTRACFSGSRGIEASYASFRSFRPCSLDRHRQNKRISRWLCRFSSKRSSNAVTMFQATFWSPLVNIPSFPLTHRTEWP